MSIKKLAKENFSFILKEYRDKRKMTLKQLSALLDGISPGFLSEVERGLKQPGSDLLFAFENLLNNVESDEIPVVNETSPGYSGIDHIEEAFLADWRNLSYEARARIVKQVKEELEREKANKEW